MAMNASCTQACTDSHYSPLPSIQFWVPSVNDNMRSPAEVNKMVGGWCRGHRRRTSGSWACQQREDEAEGCGTSFPHYPADGSREDGARHLLEKHSGNNKRVKVTRRATPVGDTERNNHKKGGEVMGNGQQWWGISFAWDCPDSPGHGP